jgi:hypothetical protein
MYQICKRFELLSTALYSWKLHKLPKKGRVHHTYLRVCIEEKILHEGSFVVQASFRFVISIQEAFSIGMFELHHVLLIREVLLSRGRSARRISKRGVCKFFLVIEAIRELAIAAKSIVLPHDSDFCWLWRLTIDLL